MKRRSKSVIQPARYGGRACPPTRDTANCNSHPCSIDCKHSWNAWTACSKTCGVGIQTRSYDVDTAASYGGDACPAKESRVCNTQQCVRDCKLSGWSKFTACTKSCGTGSKTRTKSVISDARFGGRGKERMDLASAQQRSCRLLRRHAVNERPERAADHITRTRTYTWWRTCMRSPS